MFDDAISNYKRKIIEQTSAIKFIHSTITALGSQSRLFVKMPQNIFLKQQKFAEHLQHRQTKQLLKRFET